MKVLFLTVALSLFSILQAEDSTSEDFGFQGIYFVKGMMTDKDFHGEKKPKEMSPLIITPLDNGDIEARFTVNKHGKCKEITMLLEKMSQPGLYTVEEGKRRVRVEKTSVDDHWVIFCEGEFHGNQIRFAKLVGPHPEENLQALKEYKEMAKQRGFDETKIIIPRQTEACTPEQA
ncbi:late lactation protein B-like [Gracilinanus agilis]|uniref:late lactation protein B-like n=1 Tax=Gracilinanus agilis TaxID=191870 RepID=UPI001CFCE9AB|nr:late lactation protein B-like [Gracilinanus agilis]